MLVDLPVTPALLLTLHTLPAFPSSLISLPPPPLPSIVITVLHSYIHRCAPPQPWWQGADLVLFYLSCSVTLNSAVVIHTQQTTPPVCLCYIQHMHLLRCASAQPWWQGADKPAQGDCELPQPGHEGRGPAHGTAQRTAVLGQPGACGVCVCWGIMCVDMCVVSMCVV